jgi:superfamily II DNA or RNA helicase
MNSAEVRASFDLNGHLSQLDHGQLKRIIGDAGIFDLVSSVIQARKDLPVSARGQIVLDLVGGPQNLLEVKRQQFFLTFGSDDREKLKKAIGVSDLESFSLTESRRKALYACFGLTPDQKIVQKAPPSASAIGVQYGLFPHQTKALLEALAFLESATPRVMLHMPTGSGKTRTAFHLICRHLNRREKGLVVWLVSGKELCDQAAKEFKEAWNSLGERPVPLVCLWESRTGADGESFKKWGVDSRLISAKSFDGERWPEKLSDGLIVASLDSVRNLIEDWQPGESQRRLSPVSLIVFDEAHRAVATTYKQVIDQILLSSSECGLLGLSATPGRKHFGADEGADASLVDLFRNQKVQLAIDGYKSPVAALVAQGFLAELSVERLEIAESGLSPTEISQLSQKLETSFDLPDSTLRRLGLSATRNLQIISRIEKLVKKDGCKRCIVFAPSVESANLLSSLLNAMAIRSEAVSAGTDPAVRDKIIGDYKKNDQEPYVLCNFGVLTTGFDAPQTSAVVIARPTLSIVLLNQMAGRAIRGKNVGGNAKALLITVVDTKIPELVDTIDQFHAFDKSWGEK